MEKESLGLIETLGLVPAIEAADAGSKAAKVGFRGIQRGRAGLITVTFVGDVAAVKAAVSAGAAAARLVGKVVSVHVIARPDRQLQVSSPNGSGAAQRPAPPPPIAVEEPVPPQPAEAAEMTEGAEMVGVVEVVQVAEAVVPEDLGESCAAPAVAETAVAVADVEAETPVQVDEEVPGAVPSPEEAPPLRKKEKVRKAKSKRKP